MNRKLHNTLLALSTTGLVLVAGLLVASPLTSTQPIDDNSAVLAGIVVVAPSRGAATAIAGRTAGLEARTQRFESEMRQMTDTGEAIVRTASFVAEIATDTALAAAMAGIDPAAAAEKTSAEQPARKSQRNRRTSRSAFATPYFSFAHGLRDGNGA